jgi:hypothetical protein
MLRKTQPPGRAEVMNDPYAVGPLKQSFPVGTRVVVSARGGWRNDSPGAVVAGPDAVQTMQGEDYYYWIQFDDPQRDLDDDGPYVKAQVLSRYMLLEAQLDAAADRPRPAGSPDG